MGNCWNNRFFFGYFFFDFLGVIILIGFGVDCNVWLSWVEIFWVGDGFLFRGSRNFVILLFVFVCLLRNMRWYEVVCFVDGNIFDRVFFFVRVCYLEFSRSRDGFWNCWCFSCSICFLCIFFMLWIFFKLCIFFFL